jgi:hypothetical protein
MQHRRHRRRIYVGRGPTARKLRAIGIIARAHDVPCFMAASERKFSEGPPHWRSFFARLAVVHRPVELTAQGRHTCVSTVTNHIANDPRRSSRLARNHCGLTGGLECTAYFDMHRQVMPNAYHASIDMLIQIAPNAFMHSDISIDIN